MLHTSGYGLSISSLVFDINNLTEFQRVSLTDDSYFPEYLWKEREIKDC
jgi:hypothetical protein